MTPPATVLRVITRLNVGGPTRHVDLLMRGLDPGRWSQVLVHGTAPPDEAPGLLDVAGPKISVPDLQRELHPARDRRALRRLRAIIRSRQPQVVHTHQGKAGYLGRMAAAAEGVPLVVHTYHGHTFSGYFGPAKGWLLRRAERRAARRSRFLVCQSRSQERDVLAALGAAAAGRTRVIEPAVDPGWLAAGRGEDVPPAPVAVILLPARLVPVKRPEWAIQTLAAVREHLDAELWILGDGPLRAALQESVDRAGLGAAVRFLGNRRDLGALYRAASVVLLTSAMEGTPLALIEAMVLGIPAAAPDVGGVRDILEGVGIVLPAQGPPQRWASELLPVLEARGAPDPAWRNAAEAAGRRFAPARLVRELSALYAEGLSSG